MKLYLDDQSQGAILLIKLLGAEKNAKLAKASLKLAIQFSVCRGKV